MTRLSPFKRLSPGRIPDPLKAHGAWVYLVISIIAGVLTTIGRDVLASIFVGLGFAGLFLLASCVAIGFSRKTGRAVIGMALAIGGPITAIQVGGDPSFLAYGVIAIFPMSLAGYFAEREGFMSPTALGFAVSAIVVAAPCAACAGGASDLSSWVLLILLAPFFVYRTWKIRLLMTHEKGWTRAKLKKQGIMEATYATLWTLGAVAIIHVIQSSRSL